MKIIIVLIIFQLIILFKINYIHIELKAFYKMIPQKCNI